MHAYMTLSPVGLLFLIACSDSSKSAPADSAAGMQPALEQKAMARDTKPTPRLVSTSRCLRVPRPRDCPPITTDECLAIVRTQPGDTHPSPAIARKQRGDTHPSPVALSVSDLERILKPCPVNIRNRLRGSEPAPR